MSDSSTAAAILTEATSIVDGARQQAHGSRERSFMLIANLWAEYLSQTNAAPVVLCPEHVAVMMALLKIARSACGDSSVRDHWVDGAGYLALAGELAGESR
jgi:hypothetical protein